MKESLRVEQPLSGVFHSRIVTMRTVKSQSPRLGDLVLAITTVNVVLLTYVLIDQRSDLALYLFNMYGRICHQGDGIRVFEIPVKLPLCYRCMGVHVFLFLGGWTYALFISRKTFKVSFLFLHVCVHVYGYGNACVNKNFGAPKFHSFLPTP